LKNNRNLLAADLLHVAGSERHEIAPAPQDPASDDFPGRHGNQLEHRKRGDALAAARFPHYAQRLTAADAEIDAVDCVHHAVVGGKMRL
jgi:hypothetical protein